MIHPYHMHCNKAPKAPIARTPITRTGLSFMSHVIVYHMAR